AADGIRDRNVTGVQTCALPICPVVLLHLRGRRRMRLLPLPGTFLGAWPGGYASDLPRSRGLLHVPVRTSRAGRSHHAGPDSWARAAVQPHRCQLVDDGPLPRLRTEHHDLVTALLHHEATTDPQVYGRASG